MKLDFFESIKVAVLTLVLIGTLWYIKWTLGRLRMYRLASKFEKPVLPYLPFFGNALRILKDPKNAISVFSEMAQGPTPAYYWLGPLLLIFTMRPQDLRIILKSQNCLEKSIFYMYIAENFPETMLIATVEKWRKRRKMLAPGFSTKALSTFMDIFNRNADAILEGLEESDKVLNIMEPIGLSTLKTTLDTLIGIDVDTKDTEELLKSIHYIQVLITERMLLIIQPDFIYKFTESSRVLKKHNAFIDGIFTRLLSQKLEQSDKNNKEEGTAVALDLMTMAMEKGDDLTVKDIIYEMKSTMVASYDTSSKSFCYLLLCLALYPDVQEKLYQELVDVIGEPRDITTADFSKLVYLEKVIKEALRVFPPLAMIARLCTKDIDLGDYTIPAGAQIFISILEMHRSKMFWKDPLKFDPERFSPEECAKRDSYSYLPFSHGPRNCVGFQYALSFLRVHVPKFLFKFKVETDIEKIEDVTFYTDVFLESKIGYPIRLRRRR